MRRSKGREDGRCGECCEGARERTMAAAARERGSGGGESEGLGRLEDAVVYIATWRPRSKTLSGLAWADPWSRSKRVQPNNELWAEIY
jgi:hypothetical protein